MIIGNESKRSPNPVDRVALSTYLMIGLIALIFAGVPRLIVFPLSVVHWDESSYTLVARDLTRGIVPLSGTFDHKPVFLYYVYAFPQLFLGETIAATRLLSIIVAILGAFLLGMYVRLAVTRHTMVIAMAVIVYSLFSALNRGLTAQPELIMNVFLLTVLIVLRFRFQTRLAKTSNLVTIGVLWGLCFQTNYLSAVLLAAFAIDYFFLLNRGRMWGEAVRAYLLEGIVIFLCFAATCVVLLLPVVIWGNIYEYFTLQLMYLAGYRSDNSWATTLADVPKVIRPYAFLFCLAITSLIFFAYSALRHRQGFEWTVTPRMLLYFGFACAAALAANRVYAKYYLLVLPSATILLAAVIASLPRASLVRAFACTWIILVSLYSLEQERFLLKKGITGFPRWLNGEPVDVPAQIAHDMRPSLNAGDTIYVYDYQFIMYFLTRVIPPTRYASWIHHLQDGFVRAMGIDRGAEMTSILNHHPRFIVTGSDPGDGKYGTASSILAVSLTSDYTLFGTYSDPIFDETLTQDGRRAKVTVYMRKPKPQ